MFKKQARAWSAILVVCMLLSLLSTFVLPASAEADNGTTLYYDEVISETGLIDTADFADIQSYSSSVKVYKVSDRAGLEKINSLVLGGNTLAGVTIYQAADIDLQWENFPGIGATGKVFSGTYNGNGFTIDGLYVQNAGAEGAGLFNDAKDASFWNIGIASGLLIGGMRAGSIVGGHEDKANLKFYNCWSAATVAGGGNNGTGGLAGTSVGASEFYNCYFLGMVYSREAYPGGLTGYVDSNLHIESSFNYGTVINGIATPDSASYADGIHSALIRPSGKTLGTVGKNNAYHKQDRVKSTFDSFMVNNADTTNDDAIGYTTEEFAGNEVLTRLNGSKGYPDNAGQVDEYIMLFSQSEAGYPVATYLDNDSLEVIVKRTAHTDINVGENTLAEKSELFKYVSENLGDFPSKAKLGNYEIDNANDLFVMGLLTSFRGISNASNSFARLGLTGITITKDIDMAEMDLFPIDDFVPLGSTNPFTIPVDGQGHVIKNWKTEAYALPQLVNGDAYTNVYTQTGLIAMGAGKVSNLGLEDAVTVLDYQLMGTGAEKPYAGLLVGYQSGALEITGCYVTGEVIVRNANVLNENGVGAMLGYDSDASAALKGGWAEATIKADYSGAPFDEKKLPAMGGTESATPNIANLQAVYFFAEPGEAVFGKNTFVSINRLNSDSDLKTSAVYMNQQIPGKAIWGVRDNRFVFAEDGEAIVGVYYQKMGASGYLAGLPEVVIAKVGETVTLKEYENYKVDADSLPEGMVNNQFVMPDRNIEIRYIAKTFDRGVVQAIYDRYNRMKEELFTLETVGTLKNIKLYSQYILENSQGDNVDAEELFALQTELENLVMDADLELVATYPNIPGYADYELLKDYNTSGVWGINSKEDWIAITSVPASSFNSKIELHLTQDIDMENTLTMPMNYGGVFSGVIDGHGYAFKNLNVTMADTNPNYAIGGLVSQMSGGTIRDLGVKSGIVKITNHQPSNDNYGAGVVCGWAVGTTFVKVWVDDGVTFDLTNCKNNSSYGVIVGRGANTFDACFSYCKIKTNGTPNHFSHLGDWNTSAAKLTNSFGVTSLSGSASVYMFRANASANNVQVGNNLWIVGGTNVHHSSAIATNSGKLSSNAVSNGELAYSLWANYTEGNGTRHNYTVKNGKTVVGTEDEQYYRVRVSKGSVNNDYYGQVGDVINISNSGIPADSLEVMEGSAGTLDGLNVTVGKGDMNLRAINPNGPNLFALDEVLQRYEKYNGQGYIEDFSYFVNGEALKKVFDDVIARYYVYTKADQAEIDAATEILKSGYVLDETKKVPASYSNDYCKIEGSSKYTAVGIYTNEDLEFAGSVSSSYAAGQTIYLCNDLDLANSGFSNLSNLRAVFDGQNHTITNFNSSVSFFNAIRTTSIKNIVFKNCNPSLAGDASGLVGSYQNSDNITTTFDNIIVEDCTVTRPSGKQWGVSAFYGSTIAKSHLVFNNITVRGTKIDYTEGEQPIGSSAMIISRMREGGDVTMNNILVENCENKNGSYDNAALVFGTMSKTNGSVLTMNKVIVRDNVIAAGNVGIDGVLGNAWNTGDNKVYLNNVVAYNNAAGRAGLIGGLAQNQYVYTEAKDVYTDVAVHYKDEPMGGVWVYDTEHFTTGEMAYRLNNESGNDIYAMTADGGFIFASETKKAPVELKVLSNGTAHFVAYTDYEGKLVVWDRILAKVADKWPGMPATWECCECGDPSAHAYTEDGVINVRIEGANKEYTCAHQWQGVYDGEGQHTKTCALCEAVVSETCVVGWENEDETHTGVCPECKMYYASEACAWVSVEVTEAGCKNIASEEFECSVCGDTKIETSRLSKPLGHSFNYVNNEEIPGTHHVTCDRGCGHDQLDNCIEASHTVVAPSLGAAGYTEYTCSVCYGTWKQNFVNPLAVLSAGGAALIGNGAETEAYVPLTVEGDPGMTELSFTLQYPADALALEAIAVTDPEVATVNYTTAASGEIRVNVVAKDGKTTKIDGALLMMSFDLLKTEMPKQYDIVLSDAAATANAKASPIEISDSVGYVRVISERDVNTDLKFDTVDLTDMLCHLLNKEPSSPVRPDLADFNNDTNIDLLDAVELARALSQDTSY